MSGPGAERKVEVLSAGPLVPVVRILKPPASQGDGGGCNGVSLQSRESRTGLCLGLGDKTPGKGLAVTDNWM